MAKMNKAKNTMIDGVGASEALDSTGERLMMDGLDITSLQEGTGVFNYEHKNDTPAQIVGKVLYAKKIFKPEDCENERQSYFWDKVQCPYLYVKGELFDGENSDSAKEVAAALRYDAKQRAENPKGKDVYGFSIEGSKLEKNGQEITHSIARKVTVTQAPANKSCFAEICPEEGSEDDSLDFDFMKSEKPLKKTLTASQGNVAPSSLSGFQALVPENMDKTIKDSNFGKLFSQIHAFVKKKYPAKKPQEVEAIAKVLTHRTLAKAEQALSKGVDEFGRPIKGSNVDYQRAKAQGARASVKEKNVPYPKGYEVYQSKSPSDPVQPALFRQDVFTPDEDEVFSRIREIKDPNSGKPVVQSKKKRKEQKAISYARQGHDIVPQSKKKQYEAQMEAVNRFMTGHMGPEFEIYPSEGKIDLETGERKVKEGQTLKPDLSSGKLEAQPNVAAAVHEPAHLFFIPKRLGLKAAQAYMDIGSAIVGSRYGGAAKQTEYEITPHGFENPMRRLMGISAFGGPQRSSPHSSHEELEMEHPPRMTRDTGREFAQRLKDAKGPHDLIRLARNLNPEQKKMFEDFRDKIIRYDINGGWVPNLTPDAITNLRAQGRHKEADEYRQALIDHRRAGTNPNEPRPEDNMHIHLQNIKKLTDQEKHIKSGYKNAKTENGKRKYAELGDQLAKEKARHLDLAMQMGFEPPAEWEAYVRRNPVEDYGDQDDEYATNDYRNPEAGQSLQMSEKPFHGYNKKKHSRTGGLSDSYRKKYNRETGSNLKRPVTGKVKAGSEAAGRRKSFCARMSGVKGPTSKDGKLTPKGAALKRWKCGSMGKAEDQSKKVIPPRPEGKPNPANKPRMTQKQWYNMSYKDKKAHVERQLRAEREAKLIAEGKMKSPEQKKQEFEAWAKDWAQQIKASKNK